jgi:hypothetical protein
VEENRVKVLNVAGPRVSTEPDIGEFVMAVIDAVFTKLGFLAASPTSTANDWMGIFQQRYVKRHGIAATDTVPFTREA